MFAYCTNNPVNLSDPDGTLPEWAVKVIIGTAVIAAAAALTIATAGTGTALACFAVGALKGAATGALIGAAQGAATGAILHRATTGSWEGAGQAALNGAADGYMAGAITGFITGGATSKACFVAGTAVLASTGYVAIENIKAGDYVWAWDEETGKVGLKQVVETYVNETTELVHVYVNGEDIVTTPTHPFYSPVKGWTSAIHLKAGDILVLVNGEYVIIEQVQHELLEAPIKVYNFQVESYHTYYVANCSVLVHNNCTQNGGGHGNTVHAKKIDEKIEILKKSGEYTRIYGNRSLKTAGLVGNQRPDIIAFDKLGNAHIWEYASPSQSGGRGLRALVRKISVIANNNPRASITFVPW